MVRLWFGLSGFLFGIKVEFLSWDLRFLVFGIKVWSWCFWQGLGMWGLLLFWAFSFFQFSSLLVLGFEDVGIWWRLRLEFFWYQFCKYGLKVEAELILYLSFYSELLSCFPWTVYVELCFFWFVSLLPILSWTQFVYPFHLLAMLVYVWTEFVGLYIFFLWLACWYLWTEFVDCLCISFFFCYCSELCLCWTVSLAFWLA